MVFKFILKYNCVAYTPSYSSSKYFGRFVATFLVWLIKSALWRQTTSFLFIWSSVVNISFQEKTMTCKVEWRLNPEYTRFRKRCASVNLFQMIVADDFKNVIIKRSIDTRTVPVFQVALALLVCQMVAHRHFYEGFMSFAFDRRFL